MNTRPKAHLIGGGIGSLAAAAFLIRDGAIPGANITVYEADPVMGGSLDGARTPHGGYSMRGGRMLTTDNYECTWALFKCIPSLLTEGKTVYDETVEFNERHKAHSGARLVDRQRAKVPVTSMGFSMKDRMELLALGESSEAKLGDSRITDWLSPGFFATEFWHMWAMTFAFQPWHSAVEFKRYLHRFILEFSRIETLAGVKRTIYNQYDSLVLPLQSWLAGQGVNFDGDCLVTDVDTAAGGDPLLVTGFRFQHAGSAGTVSVGEGDLVFLQNGSMTDASSLGSMVNAPAMLTKADTCGWRLWEKLAQTHPQLGNPARFNTCVAQSCWESFTVTLKNTRFFDQMCSFSGNDAGIGGLVTFKDSNWLMSVVLAHQPHFPQQPVDVQVFWGYALFPDRVGNFVPKPMEACNGADILKEICGHLRFDPDVFESADCIPCRMPYITSMFMPRSPGDRPPPVPQGSRNLAFVSQFVEIPGDVVFTVEYSVRAAQMAVYQLLGLALEVPPVTAHDASPKACIDALVKAFK